MTINKYVVEEMKEYATDILSSAGMQSEKAFAQHRDTNCYEHSFRVAYVSLLFVYLTHLPADRRSLVRGALLHDYFLYDWHDPDPSHRPHAFIHARRALNNASRDFKLSPVECDIILKHMFPVNVIPPKYRESVIVCLADKAVATCELFSIKLPFQDEL